MAAYGITRSYNCTQLCWTFSFFWSVIYGFASMVSYKLVFKRYRALSRPLLLISDIKLTKSMNTILLQKLIFAQIDKLPVFYGTQKFSTMFTRVQHWNRSWASLIQSTQSDPMFKIPFNINIPAIPRFSNGLFSSHTQIKMPVLCPFPFPRCVVYFSLISSHLILSLHSSRASDNSQQNCSAMKQPLIKWGFVQFLKKRQKLHNVSKVGSTPVSG